MLLPSFSLNCNLRNLLFKHKRLFTGVISAGLSLSNDCNVLILPDSSTVSSVLGSPSKDTLLTILWARWSASWIEINYKHWQYWQGIDKCRIRKKYNDTRNTTSASCVLMFLFWQSCRFPSPCLGWLTWKCWRNWEPKTWEIHRTSQPNWRRVVSEFLAPAISWSTFHLNQLDLAQLECPKTAVLENKSPQKGKSFLPYAFCSFSILALRGSSHGFPISPCHGNFWQANKRQDCHMLPY